MIFLFPLDVVLGVVLVVVEPLLEGLVVAVSSDVLNTTPLLCAAATREYLFMSQILSKKLKHSCEDPTKTWTFKTSQMYMNRLRLHNFGTIVAQLHIWELESCTIITDISWTLHSCTVAGGWNLYNYHRHQLHSLNSLTSHLAVNLSSDKHSGGARSSSKWNLAIWNQVLEIGDPDCFQKVQSTGCNWKEKNFYHFYQPTSYWVKIYLPVQAWIQWNIKLVIV